MTALSVVAVLVVLGTSPTDPRTEHAAGRSDSAAQQVGDERLAAAADRPVRTARFVSSSGRTAVDYYAYDLSNGFFDGTVTGPVGFEIATIGVSGFGLRSTTGVAPIHRVDVDLQFLSYDPTGGATGIRVGAGGSGLGAVGTLTFVLIYSHAEIARFTALGVSCGQVARCSARRVVPAAVPPGMQYVGVAVTEWQLDCGDFLESIEPYHIGGYLSPPRVGAGGEVTLDLHGVCTDFGLDDLMSIEYGGSVLAFDPSEVAPVVTRPIRGTGNRRMSRIVAYEAPSGAPVTGFLGTFVGAQHRFLLGPVPDHPIWMLEATANRPTMTAAGAEVLSRMFIGTRFPDVTFTERFQHTLYRTAAFLR